MKIISIYSTKGTIEEAAIDLQNQYHTLFGENTARLVIFFSTSTFDPTEVSKKVKAVFGEADVFGCTTAGELVSGHMLKNSIVAMVFDAEAVLDALHPGQVRIDAVDRQAQQLAIHALEQVGLLGKTHELGGAHGSEVCRVREQDQPLALVILQGTRTVSRIGGEGRGSFVDTGQRHGDSLRV